MTQAMAPPVVTLIPETAPFSPEQRTWLNGFFAGLVSLDGAGVTALSAAESAALMPQRAALLDAADEDDGGAPWHDQALPLAERMQRAEGRPLRWRLMAAMAQQDCGQCGYNCADYSAAIFGRQEQRLNLCVPGGKETARTLRTLHQELDPAPVTPAVPAIVSPNAVETTARPGERGRSRNNA